MIKNTNLTEHLNLQVRGEFYNIFNHAQFLTPSGIITYSLQGLPNPNTMGQVPGARDPRIGQVSAKFNF